MLVRYQHERVADFIPSGYAVPVFEVPRYPGVVRVRPQSFTVIRRPGQLAQYEPAGRKVVYGYFAGQLRVTVEDADDVVHRLSRFAGILVVLQLCRLHPVDVGRLLYGRKYVRRARCGGCVKVCHNVPVLHGQVFHRLIRRQLIRRRAVFDVCVLVAKPVQPDEVKRVDELPAARVGRVMTV